VVTRDDAQVAEGEEYEVSFESRTQPRGPDEPARVRRLGGKRGLAALLLALGVLLGACTADAPQVQTGMPAPAFVVEHLDRSSVRFPEDLRGHATVVHFWADWCPNCRDEMHALETVYRDHRDLGLRVLAVNVGQSRPAVAAGLLRVIDISYDVLLDPDSTVAARYGVIGLPTTVLVDRRGVVHARIVGEADAAVLNRAVKDLLASGEPASATDRRTPVLDP
jgi:cytochrome c biogenesis protein CcmG, thiol:disulfide interchange protein DsbE